MLKKALDRGQDLGTGNLGGSLASQSNNFILIATVPVPKSYENYTAKKLLFMCLPPASFESGFGFVSGFEVHVGISPLWIVKTIVP